jgi:hypothetical protein
MQNTWFKLHVEIESENSDFRQTLYVYDMVYTEYNRLLDDSIIDKYKKAMKACGGKFKMLTICLSKSSNNSYLYEPIQQYRFTGDSSTPTNPNGIEGSQFYNNMFGDFQPCDKKDIVAKIKAYVAKANSLYVEAIKENSQQLIAG